MTKLAVVIPCFNEQDNIAAFVRSLQLLKQKYEMDLTPIVVNDCSTDNTVSVLAQLRDIIVLQLPINLGIGGAVQTGFRYALRHGFDVAVQMDGDGQHPASELTKLLIVWEKEKPDVVIGSRFLTFEGFQSTWLRRVGIIWFSRLIRLISGQNITDPTSGFRLLNRKAMQIVDKYYPIEYPEPEILTHFLYRKLTVREVQVEMSERLGGVSSIKSWKSAYYMLKVTAGILFSKLRLMIYDKH